MIRIWQSSDEADVIQAANDSRPLIAARWPASRGGAAAVPLYTPAFYQKNLAVPFRLGMIVDLTSEAAPIGGHRCVGFMAANLWDDRIADIDLRVRFVTQGSAQQRRTNTALRLRRVMHDTLLYMAAQVPPSMPIFAEYPDPGAGNPELISTVYSVLTYMEQHNGLVRAEADGMISWPGLTAGHVTQGLQGFIP